MQENDNPLQLQTTIPTLTNARKLQPTAGANNNSYPNNCKKTTTHSRCKQPILTARKRWPTTGAMCTAHHHSSLPGTVTLCLIKQTYLLLQMKAGFMQYHMHINTY